MPQHSDRVMNGLLGPLTVLAGLGVAINVMPDDPRPPGAMFWPALWLALGLLAVPMVRIQRSVGSMFRAEYLLMVALVYWLLLDPIRSAYPMYRVSYDSIVLALTSIAIAAIGIWFGAAVKGWRPPNLIFQTTRLSFSDSGLFQAVLIAFFLGIFYFAFSSGFDIPVMIANLGASRFAAPWSRGSLGDWRSFVEQMQYFGFVLPSLTVVLAYRKGWLHPRVIISALLSLIMVLFLAQGGGRRIIGVVIGAAVLDWIVLQRRLKPRLILGVVVSAIVLLAVMHEMLVYRAVGFSEALAGKSGQTYSYLHVDDNFLRLSQTTLLFPNTQPYVGLQPMTYALVLPVPRVLWPDKPTGPGYDLSKLVGIKGVSLSTSIVGEFYTMGGLFAVFLGGLFLGWLAAMWNNVLDLPGGTEKTVVWGLGIMVLFAGIRSMQALVLMSYGVIGWLIVTQLLHWRKSEQRAGPERVPAAPGRRIKLP